MTVLGAKTLGLTTTLAARDNTFLNYFLKKLLRMRLEGFIQSQKNLGVKTHKIESFRFIIFFLNDDRTKKRKRLQRRKNKL